MDPLSSAPVSVDSSNSTAPTPIPKPKRSRKPKPKNKGQSSKLKSTSTSASSMDPAPSGGGPSSSSSSSSNSHSNAPSSSILAGVRSGAPDADKADANKNKRQRIRTRKPKASRETAMLDDTAAATGHMMPASLLSNPLRLNPNARPFVPASSTSTGLSATVSTTTTNAAVAGASSSSSLSSVDPTTRASRAIPIRRPQPAVANSPKPTFPLKNNNNNNKSAATSTRPLPAAATALAALSSHGHDYTPLALSLATDLIRGTKECVICCDAIKPRNPIWSCSTCYAPLHLACVKEWAASHTPPTTDLPAGAPPETKAMRCPACNCAQPLDSARFYTCFCNQVRNPPLDRFTTPHACGKSCDRLLPDCPHKCTLPCHPGPCSPCAKIITVSCPGGHVKRQATCGTQAATAPVPCAAPCGQLLNCGKHMCEQTCHAMDDDNNAHKCTQEVRVACQCGRSDPKTYHCGSEPPAKQRTCDRVCGLPFPCGHTCPATCCPLSPADHLLCPRSPALINKCPCGKSRLNRTSCHDPTATSCGKPCGEPLPCGHACSRTCHADKDNHRCTSTMQATCRCGLVTSSLPCAVFNDMLARGDPFLCDLVCDAPLMCRRKGHKCKSLCCPASKAAIAATLPSSSSSSSSRPNTASSAWTSLESHLAHEALTATTRRQLDTQFHTCAHTCGKSLACGQHTCAYPCHAGACPPCLEASFDELFCACGRSSIVPPVPCGTTAVPCAYPCTRTRACGHANLGTHECHADSVACPPCVVLTEKPCACGKSTVGATRCASSVPPACGARCGRALPCGHKCSLGCHDPGVNPCVCRDVCGLRREMTCGHACPLPCHAAQGTCEEVAGACAVKVTRQCACGRLTQVGTCQPGRNSVPLECDDGCRVAARNRVVADALKVNMRARTVQAAGTESDQDNDVVNDDTTNPGYDQATLEYARLHAEFARELEHTLADLIAEAERDTRGGVAMRNLKKPMKQPVRKFVHAVAAAWHVQSESVDPEPKRLVILTARRGVSGPPRWTCAEAVRRWVLSGAQAVGTAGVVAAAAVKPVKRGAPASVATATPTVNALVIQDTPLASPLDVEPYCRLYFGSTPFSVVRHAPSRTDPTKFEAVVQVAAGSVSGSSSAAAYMPPHAVQDLIRDVRGPLHSLLVDLGKAQAVVEAYVDRKGKVTFGQGFTRVMGGKKGLASTSEEEEDGVEAGQRRPGIVPIVPSVATRNAFDTLLDLPSSPAKSTVASSSTAAAGATLQERNDADVVDDWEQEADD